MSLSGIMGQLLTIGRQVVPLIIPGAGAAISLGAKIADAIEDGKHVLGPQDQAQAEKITADLRTRVNAHVDRTVDRLRNG